MSSFRTYCPTLLSVLCLLTILCLFQPAYAQQTPDPITTGTVSAKKRPKIALVFSGGGARGGAHIGVLKVLEERHIPVDIIVGTSSGSIVGAAYASGMKLEEIEKLMAGLNTANLFRDTSRQDESFDQKSNDSLNLIGPEIGLSSQGVGLPKGVVAGVSVEAVLRRLTSHQQSQDFNKLPIPFRAVATDLTSAQMVVLDHGDLAQSIRASMAIPAVVNPVEIDGRLLVDGGLARNLPVDVARKMGADVVIAVNISTPLLKRNEITSVLSVSSQILRIMTATNVEQSIKELGPQDVLITPDLGDLSSADFDRLAEAAEIGEKATEQLNDKLARYSVSAANYNSIQMARTADIPKDLIAQRIDDIRVTGTSKVNPDVILATMKTRSGQDFNETEVDKDMKRIYALGDFERVGYTWTEDPNLGRILTANVVEKSWGPNYLRFGLGLSTDFEGNSYFQLMASHRWKWLNSLGGEWRNDLQIGRNDLFRSEWYQPLTPAQRIFVAARVEGTRDPFDLYLDGQRIASYRRQTYDIGFDVGAPLSTMGEVRLGLIRGHIRMLNDTTPFLDTELPSANTGGVLAQLRVDTLDNMHFPRSGYKGEVSLYSSTGRLGATDDYAKISANFDAAFSYRRHSVMLGMRGAKGLGNNPLPDYELFCLGGFLQLSGYKTGELLGRQVTFGRIIYNYQLSGPGFFDGTYLGASLEIGKIGDSIFTSSDTPWTHGASVYLGLDTFLGPIYLAYGRGNTKNQAVYFFLGQPF